MKKKICLALIFLFSASAFAHPGKTDRRGGHKCWKNCTGWELRFGEYHLHDKDWKPIRLDARGNPIPDEPPPHDMTSSQEPQERAEPPKPEQTGLRPSGDNVPGKPETRIIKEYKHTTVVREEEILSLNNILLLALIFLLLAALIFIRQGRGKD